MFGYWTTETRAILTITHHTIWMMSLRILLDSWMIIRSLWQLLVVTVSVPRSPLPLPLSIWIDSLVLFLLKVVLLIIRIMKLIKSWKAMLNWLNLLTLLTWISVRFIELLIMEFLAPNGVKSSSKTWPLTSQLSSGNSTVLILPRIWTSTFLMFHTGVKTTVSGLEMLWLFSLLNLDGYILPPILYLSIMCSLVSKDSSPVISLPGPTVTQAL